METIERLQERYNNYKQLAGIPCPACSMDDASTAIPCYCGDVMDAKQEIESALLNAAPTLLAVAKSAKILVQYGLDDITSNDKLADVRKALQALAEMGGNSFSR